MHLAPDDPEQVGLFVRKQFSFPQLEHVRHGHISARQILPAIGAETFAGYFKFAFVRNPFDRFVSYCAFMSRASGDFERTPKAFMNYVLDELKPVDHILFRPQHEFLVDSAGAIAMDFVGRTETLQISYDSVCASIGIASADLGTINASSHRAYAEYYDADLVDRVSDLYARDLSLFHYRFDGHASQSAQDHVGPISRAG